MLCVMKFFYIFQHFSFQMGGWLWSFSRSPYVLSQTNSKILFFLHSDQSVNSMSEESVGFSGHVFFSYILLSIFILR